MFTQIKLKTIKKMAKKAPISEARISSGTYQTKGYFSKTYKTRAGLESGLKSFGYPYSDLVSGMEWNYGGRKYKLSIQWN